MPGRRERVADGDETTFTKAQELRSFLFLAVVMAPVLAVIFVSGYGFIVWMYQLIAGPPGS
jgi:nitrate reductase NapE